MYRLRAYIDENVSYYHNKIEGNSILIFLSDESRSIKSLFVIKGRCFLFCFENSVLISSAKPCVEENVVFDHKTDVSTTKTITAPLSDHNDSARRTDGSSTRHEYAEGDVQRCSADIAFATIRSLY